MTAKIIPMSPPPVIEDKCSFCGTPKKHTKVLLGSGQGHFICDACVQRAKQRRDMST